MTQCTKLQQIKSFLLSKHETSSVCFLVISALISTVISAGMSVGVDRYYKARDDRNSNHDKKVSLFIQSANGLDALVGFYIEAVAQSPSSLKDAKDKLYAGLNDQIHKAEDAEIYLNKDEKNQTECYVAKLDELIAILQKPDADNVLKMKTFWQTMSEIVTIRSKLSSELQS